MRGFIEELLERELTAALRRKRHERARGEPAGCRNETRERQVLGNFGPTQIGVLCARMAVDGSTQEWRSTALPRCPRMTRQVRPEAGQTGVEALIAGVFTVWNQHAQREARADGLIRGAVGKDVVSRTWRKVRTDGTHALGRLEQAGTGRGRHRAAHPGRHRLAGGGSGRVAGRDDNACPSQLRRLSVATSGFAPASIACALAGTASIHAASKMASTVTLGGGSVACESGRGRAGYGGSEGGGSGAGGLGL